MKKCFLPFIVFIFMHAFAFSQKLLQAKIDSLRTEILQEKNDSIKIDHIAEILRLHVGYNPNEGLAYEKSGLELAQKNNYKNGLALITFTAGRIYWRMGNFQEALNRHFKSLEIYKQIDNRQQEAATLISIAQDYFDSGNPDTAKTYLHLAINLCTSIDDKYNLSAAYDILTYIFDTEGNISESVKSGFEYVRVNEQLGNQSGIAHGYSNLGYSFRTIGNEVDALKYFRQALRAARETDDQLEIADIESNMGDIYIENGNFVEALKHYTAAMQAAEESKDVPKIAEVHFGLGKLYRKDGRYEESLNYFLIAEKEFKSLSNKNSLAALYTEMGIAYTRIQKFDLAKKYFEASRSLASDLNNKPLFRDYYNGRQLFDSATGNWQSAYLHYQQYISARDSTFNKDALKKMVASQMQYESDKKEAVTKAEQEKKDVMAQATIKRQRNIRNFTFVALSLAIIFTIIVYRQRNKLAREKKRSDQLVEDKELLLREIHHRVKNNLEVVSSLLALQSAQIDDPNTKEAMQDGQNRVHSIGIVHQKLYQGENLGSIEMKDYFINLSESILDSFGAEGRVNVEFAMDKLNIDIDTAVPLGLIVNELLTNTLKYAFPDKKNGAVRIKLEKQTGGILHLEVSDNGVGKSGVTHGTGFGGQLVSLLTRQLNGSMKEEVKNGTHIFFDFKLDKVA